MQQDVSPPKEDMDAQHEKPKGREEKGRQERNTYW